MRFLLLILSMWVVNVAAQQADDWPRRFYAASFLNHGESKTTELQNLISELNTQLKGDAAADSLLTGWRGVTKVELASQLQGADKLKMLKQARQDLCMALDAEQFQDVFAAYLATLYDNAPGWPISFGNDDKARQLFDYAALHQPGPVYYYLYGMYLLNHQQFRAAEAEFLQLAQHSGEIPSNVLLALRQRGQLAMINNQ